MRILLLLPALLLPLAHCEELKAPELKTIIEKLKSDDPDERVQARKKLVEQGPAIRSELTTALAEAKEPDFKSQLQQVLRESHDWELLSRFDNPARISVEWKDVTVGTALTQMQDTFQFKVEATAEAQEKKFNATLKDATYFEALEILRSAAGLAYVRGQEAVGKSEKNELRITLAVLPEKARFAVKAVGPFLFWVDRVESTTTRTTNFAQGTDKLETQSNLVLHMLSEPDLPASRAYLSMPEILDSTGAKLQVNSINGFSADFNREKYSSISTDLSIDFVHSPDFKPPYKLSFSLECVIPLRLAEMVIEQPGKPGHTLVEVEGGSLTMEEFGGTDTRPTMKVKGKGKGAVLADSMMLNRDGELFLSGQEQYPASVSLNQDRQTSAVFITKKGEPMHSGGSGSGSKDAYELELRLQESPAKLKIRIASEPSKRTFKLILDGITLP